ncbi:MAG: hypothetical protein WC592_00210 [Candidatus Omnitrophota bacterium]
MPAKNAVSVRPIGRKAFPPDVFKCAVDMCGPSNLVTLLKSLPPQWTTERRSFYEMVGDSDTGAHRARG